MKIIPASFEIIDYSRFAIANIEKIARTCYQSEGKDSKPGDLVRKLIKLEHFSMIEHSFLSVKFIIDRGVSHELVRHRLASFAQESTRYCNYSKDKFGNELTFIKPCFFRGKENFMGYLLWNEACKNAELSYINMIDEGLSPQEARSVLPNSLKTELVVTANFREWRTIFNLRCSKNAHPQMQEVMIPLRNTCKATWPEIFD